MKDKNHMDWHAGHTKTVVKRSKKIGKCAPFVLPRDLEKRGLGVSLF